MSDLISAIRADHTKVLDAVERVATSYARLPLGEHRSRRALHDLVILEARHEVAEARILWPAVRDLMPELAEVRDVARRQERLASWQLHRLHRARTTAVGRELAPKLVQALRSHIALEETQVLDALEARLSISDAMNLGPLFQKTSAAGPTRPHPRIPAVPGILAFVNPLARRVDRVRDLLHLP